jgi:hypothetical protein
LTSERSTSAKALHCITCLATQMVNHICKHRRTWMLTWTGLIGMQINMPDSGTFFFISDHCHVGDLVLTFPSQAYELDVGHRKLARWYSTRMAGQRPPSMVLQYSATEAVGGYHQGSNRSRPRQGDILGVAEGGYNLHLMAQASTSVKYLKQNDLLLIPPRSIVNWSWILRCEI